MKQKNYFQNKVNTKYIIFKKEDVERKSNESSDEIFNKNFLDYENNQNQNTNPGNLFLNNNIEQKETSNVSKEVSLSRGEEEFIQKDILQEIEKSPKKRMSNGSFKYEEKFENRSKDSKESNEGFTNKNFILKSALCQNDNVNEYKNHSFSSKNKDNSNNRFSQ